MRDLFLSFGIDISSSHEEMLKSYFDLLISWNEKINLTSITSYDEVLVKHFLDSALILSSSVSDLNLSSDSRVLDVGTGAGFPGMVLAILKPEWKFVLLDSLGKRVEFLNVIIEKLSLDNVVAIHGRAEDIARDQNYREGFDLVVSRAVADMRLLLELCIPFVNEDGFFVSYKGPRFAEELSTASHALEELNVKCVSDVSFDLSGADRSLVFFKRDGLLSDRYPRRAGIPAKRPL